MRDLREGILARILETLQAIDPATIDEGLETIYVLRNATRVDDAQRPAIVLLDGDEEIRDEDMKIADPKVATHMHMMPTILLFCSKAEEAGTFVNAMRLQVLKAIAFDGTLKSLKGIRHPIKYLGCESGFQFSQATDADIALKYQLTYVLNPAQFDESE